MANLTDAQENTVLDDLVGTGYLAAFTADPTDTGDVSSEVSGGGYARVDIGGSFPAASGGSVSNNIDIQFPTASEDWGTITHIGIMESGTFGTADMKAWIALDATVTVNNGYILTIPSGSLTITAD